MSLTTAQYKKFQALVDNVGARDQVTRLTARLRLNKFVMEHGKEACDEAFAKENERRKKRSRK